MSHLIILHATSPPSHHPWLLLPLSPLCNISPSLLHLIIPGINELNQGKQTAAVHWWKRGGGVNLVSLANIKSANPPICCSSNWTPPPPLFISMDRSHNWISCLTTCDQALLTIIICPHPPRESGAISQSIKSMSWLKQFNLIRIQWHF